MTRAGGFALLLLTAVGGGACHSQSHILTARDGGSGGASGGTPDAGGIGSAGRSGGSGGAGGAIDFGAGTAFPHGIGTEWKWNAGVVAHTAGPYAPCGMVGTGSVVFGAASPTSSEIAATSRSGVVMFFSPETGKQVRPPYYGAGPLSGVDYSRDGAQLVVAGATGLQIIRLVDRTVILSTKPFAFATLAAALSPDGSLVAAIGQDLRPTSSGAFATLRLLLASDGSLISETSVDVADGVPPQFSPDGKLLAAGPKLLSVPRLETQPIPLQFYPQRIALSPDGTKAAQGGHVIDLASGQELKGLQQAQYGFLWSAFSPDGATYAESFEDMIIHLWRTSDWTPIGTPTSLVVMPGINGNSADGRFFFSGDGTRLISTLGRAAYDGNYSPALQIVSVPELERRGFIAEPQLGAPAVFSPDGSLVVGNGYGDGLGVWRTADLSRLARLPEASGRYAFLGNGMLAVLTSSVYNPLDGTLIGRALGSAISPDGTLAVVNGIVGGPVTIVRLADLTTRTILDARLFDVFSQPLWLFTSDNRFAAGAGADTLGDPKVIVFDATTGVAVSKLAGAAPFAITTTPRGAVRLAARLPGTFNVRVWSVPDGAALFDIAGAADDWVNLTTVAFSPDGSLIAAGIDDIRIYRVETGALRETLTAHTDHVFALNNYYQGVTSLAFSASGQLASIGWDGTMRLWCSP